MRKCPVCGKENETLLCAQCGFDGSMDYERYPTLEQVTAQAISGQKAAYNSMMQDYYRCTGCGGRQFYLKKGNLQPVCVSCGRIKKLAPAATPAPEVRIETPVVPLVTAVSEQDNQPTTLLPVIYNGSTIAAGSAHTVAVRADGRVVATGESDYGQCNVSGWVDIVAVAAGYSHTLGLRADGTVVAAGKNFKGECSVSHWKDIVAIAACGFHSIGLKTDGTVVDTTDLQGKSGTASWKDIIAVAAGDSHFIGLRSNGTVVAAGSNTFGQCNVSGWKDIIAIAAGLNHTVGLSADGCVYATGENRDEQCNVAQWDHITTIAAGYDFTIGIKHNKTVVVAGSMNTPTWNRIVAIARGASHIVGLKSNGTVVATGSNYHGQCNVTEWKSIRLPQNEQTPKKRLGFLSR